MKTLSIFLITSAVLTYAILFTSAVYMQAHTFSCPPGPQGPEGLQGPIGPDGRPETNTTVFINTNPLTLTLQPQQQQQQQDLPGTGIPWQTLTRDGDSALYTWQFQINDPQPLPADQISLRISFSAGQIPKPFRILTEPNTNIQLVWNRNTSQSPSIAVLVTRESYMTATITALQNLEWQNADDDSPLINQTSQNVLVQNLDYTTQDMVVVATLHVDNDETTTPETLVMLNTDVQVFSV